MLSFLMPMVVILAAGIIMALTNRHYERKRTRLRAEHERQRAKWEALDELARSFYMGSFRVGGVTAAFRQMADVMAGVPADELILAVSEAERLERQSWLEESR